MKFKTHRVSMLLTLLILIAVFPAHALAKSEFFSQSCVSCHSDDSPTCNGCHAHGVWQDSSRNSMNLTATTDLDRYQPRQTVTVTFSGGYRNGWIRAILRDHNGQEIDRVTGPTGMGDDGTQAAELQFPVLLSSPAPSEPGFYTWTASWFGSPFDENNATVFPHAEESVPTNEFEVYALPTCQDADGDGFEDAACNRDPQTGGGDCDDTNPSINPGVVEIPYNGIDDDCEPATPDDDIDGDGYPLAEDCDDNNPDVNPGAPEICDDGIDNDCDGLVDSEDPDCDGPPPVDMDGDGYPADVDCDDANPNVNPGASEICDDGLDNDCDGLADSTDPDCSPPPTGSLDAYVKKLKAPKKVVVESSRAREKKIHVDVRAKGKRGETASGILYLFKDDELVGSVPVTLSGFGRDKKVKHVFSCMLDENDSPSCLWEATISIDGDPNPSNNTSSRTTRVIVKQEKHENKEDDLARKVRYIK